uniref:WD repeat and FYVE domain-containing protein 3 n=1 Tax=Tetranychus urticae TaxID=32264 RepID=T1KMA3_TETUR
MQSSDQQLYLAHLNKLFNEIKTSQYAFRDVGGPSKYDIHAHEAINEYESKIYRLLPLFLKVYGPSASTPGSPPTKTSGELFDNFSDLHTLTNIVSRLMVTEIRRRASNKTTQEASEAIVNFLEISQEQVSTTVTPTNSAFNLSSVSRQGTRSDSSNNDSKYEQKGWIVLCTLNLVVCHGNESLIPVMAANSLPSTLVRCLYLFFDLPPPATQADSSDQQTTVESAAKKLGKLRFSAKGVSNYAENIEYSNPIERRLLLHRIFTQLLTRLCAHQASLHELTRKDDLALLFNAVTSWCVPHNCIWRQSAADVILIMAKCNCIKTSYLHDKSCISVSIENISRMYELSKASEDEIYEMLSVMINFITEVYYAHPPSVGILLDDFKTNLGYHFIVDFVLKLERDTTTHANIIRKVLSLVTSLTKIGTSELKPRPLSVNQLFIMSDFTCPKPNPKHSVKNLNAITVLQSLWFKAKSTLVQELILAGLFTLYRDDRANYFILDSQNTLSQFAEKLHLRSVSIQEKFFTILEYIIFEIKYVPCKELISASLMIKSKLPTQSELLSLKSLLTIIKFNSIFPDVFREVGLLEIITSLLIERGQAIMAATNVDATELQLLEITMEIIYNMLMGPNNQNCALFNEAQGPKHIFNFLPLTSSRISKQTRKLCFLIIHQLILSNNGDETLANLLSMLHTSGPVDSISNIEKPKLTLIQEISLKLSILKGLLQVVRESHRCRALFRKVGGFIYVMSVLVGMEGCLADEEIPDEFKAKLPVDRRHYSQWCTIEKKKIWNLLKYVFTTLAAAMRFEPANARFFANEICPVSLTDSLRLLGCFTHDKQLQSNTTHSREDTDLLSNYRDIFYCSLTTLPPKQSMTFLESCALIMRLLLDMALDLIDKTPKNHPLAVNHQRESNENLDVGNKSTNQTNQNKRPPQLPLSVNNPANEPPVIVHSSVIIVMFHLIPSIPCESLQLFLTQALRPLMKSERNQQVMCEANLLNEILSDKLNISLLNESHYLHFTMQYILERLSAQSISPKELRSFLRLGNPLNCLTYDEVTKKKEMREENRKPGGPIALSRVKTLVSMTTPRDTGVANLLEPPFVEFDMSQEGFSCLFLPSIAPFSSGSGSSSATNIFTGTITGSTDSNKQSSTCNGGVNGGIGTGERSFPPQAGLTFLTWICVEKFPTYEDEIHNIRLFTVTRGVTSGQEYACFQLQISARDRALLISTQEIPIFGDDESSFSPDHFNLEIDYNLRVWSPELLRENQWHQVVVVLNRALLKNSSATIYVDGHLISSQKLHYINTASSGTVLNNNQSFVNGFIGTPPQWRKQSRLIWKQGPCHFLEEPLTVNHVMYIHSLGHNYIGSFQGTSLIQEMTSLSSSLQQIPEDKVVFGLSARAISIMTLAKMKRVYSRFDCRQISKIIGLSLHENATPIYVLHNSAGHLCGPSRSLGAILIGYIGARCFIPRPVSVTLQDIGGCAILLGLVANSQDVESLYASIKALVCVLKVNKEMVCEMERIKGYQTLAMILRKKRHHLNSHVLHLTFNLVGTVDVYRKNENSSLEIQQAKAFKDLLCDQIDLWAQNDLLKSLLEHFNELLLESSHGNYPQAENRFKNLRILRDLGLLSRLLQLLWTHKSLDPKIMQITGILITALLNQTPRPTDLLYFGQYLASLLPSTDETERPPEIIELRNALLKIVLKLMTRIPKVQANHAFQEEIVRTLGFDWFLLFLQGKGLNKDTVAIGMVNLMVLISNPANYVRFKEGSSNGGWIKDAETNFRNRSRFQLLGFNMPSPSPTPPISSPSFPAFSSGIKQPTGHKIIREDIFTIPGFQHLSWLMNCHLDKPQVYLILFQGLVGQFVQLSASVICAIESFDELSLDNLWNFLFDHHRRSYQSSESNLICPDLTLTILSMIHSLIWDENVSPAASSYAVILVQFLVLLYHNRKDFQTYCHTNIEFVVALCRVIVSDKDKGTNNILTTHEARKHVMDFIRLIIVDSMICAPGPVSKASAVIEAFLSSFSNSKLAQTELLKSLMDHLDSLTAVISQQQHFETTGDNQQNHLHQQTISNIVLFSTILSDKIWQECYLRDRKEILGFQLNLVTKLVFSNQSGNKNARGVNNNELALLYRSINRTVLFLLSRPVETIPDRMTMLESLQRVHNYRRIILVAPNNSDSSFFACLTYCLLQLIDEEKNRLMNKTRTQWHSTEGESESIVQPDEGALLIASVSRKIWNEIYLSKKSVLEEALKINLVPNPSSFGIVSEIPDLGSLRDSLTDITHKFWINYQESEQLRQKRVKTGLSNLSIDSPSSPGPTALISEKLGNINKLTQVVNSGGGLMSKIVGGTTGAVSGALSNAVGSTIKKEIFKSSIATDANLTKGTVAVWNSMSPSEVAACTYDHISLISELVDSQLKQKIQSDVHLLKYVYDEWIACENELLTREKAIWGPEHGSKNLDKWKLDMTEGPHRMRRKMVKNELFYVHYPYRPEVDSSKTIGRKKGKYNPPISFDSRDYFKRFRSEAHILLERDTSFDTDPDKTTDDEIFSGNTTSEERENSFEGIKTSAFLPVKTPSTDQDDSYVDLTADSSAHVGDGVIESNSWEQVEAQTVLRLLEDNEKISHMFRCARILGLDTFEGLLLFGKEHFYLIDGFTLLKTREIRDIDSLPPDMHDSIVPTTASPRESVSSVGKSSTKKICMKFAYEDIKEVHKRRYLLQPIALEIFSMDGRNSLLVFPRKLRNKVFSRFMSVATHIIDNAHDSLSGQKRNVNVESGTGLLSSLIGDTSVTQRWARGEISNLQYLMHLNTLAGRSYNDLMQYPVFPWILADYSSPELDLNDPLSFRDLSKPMGAQTTDRLEQFRKRYNEWDDLHGETPPYHYGTFYSSAMIVASYLVRMEPFTQNFLRLQGGHFDLADRMFHSVGDAYMSAAKNNMADVKELIPEFFNLPEFLVNHNAYDLGVKQNGVRLGDVILPPWAKGDAREFIRMHRAALECDYVSAHLHEWIDLIFGYKQQGPAAVEAINVFHHLFYEGNVDIYSIEDPLKKNATIGFINNFGQIPKQLFKKPHPVKKVHTGNGAPLTPILPSVGLNNVLLSGDQGQDKVVIHNLESLRPSLHPIKELKGAVGQIIQQEKTLLAVEQNKVLIPPTYNRYVAWGFADHSLRIGPYESDRALYIFESDFLPPNGEILCGTVPNSRLLITANTSSVITVWRFKGKNHSLQLLTNLFGHKEAITCLTSSAAYGIIVSGSRDRTCIVWDLNRLLFVRQLGGSSENDLIHPSPIAAVSINDLTGDIATCSGSWLFFWSINGDLLASVNTLSISQVDMNPTLSNQSFPAPSTQILCAAFSLYNEWDLDNVIMTGSSDGVVRLWSLQYVQVPIDDDDVNNGSIISSSSDSSKVSTPRESDDPHLNTCPDRDEIVRRMSLASVIAEEINKDEEASSDDSQAEDRETPVVHESPSDPKQEAKFLNENINVKTDVNIIHEDGTEERDIDNANDFRKNNDQPDGQSTSKPNFHKKKIPAPLEIPKIRASKSDTSLIDSALSGGNMIGSILKPGYKWQRKLVFRSKLTMHTAFERKDNAEPAAITALAISKDNKTIFVGDARGRIFSWSVSEGRGLGDHWVKDEIVEYCAQCNVKFTFSGRKHHCRNCGLVFCSKCSKYEAEVKRLKTKKPVRVCYNCFISLQKQQ